MHKFNFIENENKQLKVENSRLRTDIELKNKENAEITKDINEIVNENQKMNEIHNDLLLQINQLNDELYRIRDDKRVNEDQLRTRESQVDDVMIMYKRVCEENEKLKSINDNICNDKLRVEGYSSSIESEKEGLTQENRSLKQEIEYYKDNLDVLNEKVTE